MKSRPQLLAFLPVFAVLALHGPALADGKTGSGHRKVYPPGVRSLEVCSDGPRLHLLLGEFTPGEEAPLLTHRVSTDGGVTWSEPVRVNESVDQPHGLHRGVDARIAAHGEQLVAAWTTAGNDRWGSGPIATVLSSDGGKTWSPGPNPADDNRTDGHNYLALGADESGIFHLAWLDARDGDRGLRYSSSRDGGRSWSKNSTAVSKTCECCWNNLLPLGTGGIGVLYRGHSPRDMHIVINGNGGEIWEKPVPVGDFRWEINMCPHVGGALASGGGPGGKRLHAAVWTGASGSWGLYHLHSDDSGRSWSEPFKMNVPMSWHPHIAADHKGRVAAVWDTMTAASPEVWGAISADSGQTWTAPRKLSADGVPAGFPKVVSAGGGFRVFWSSEVRDSPATWTSVVFSR